MAAAVSELKRKSKLKEDAELPLSSGNLLGGAISTKFGLFAIPRKGSVEIHKWPLTNDEIDESIPFAIISLEDEKTAPAFLEWGTSDVCPSFLAVSQYGSIQIFQCEYKDKKKQAISTMSIAKIPLSKRPTGLAWHPKRCVLAVLDNNNASLYDISSPVKGALLEKIVKFSVSNSLKYGTWASCDNNNNNDNMNKNSNNGACSDEEYSLGADLVLGGRSEINLFPAHSSMKECHRCISGDGRHENGNFKTVSSIPVCGDHKIKNKSNSNVLFCSYENGDLITNIRNDFGSNNNGSDKPRSLNCVFNESVSMSKNKNKTSSKTENKSERDNEKEISTLTLKTTLRETDKKGGGGIVEVVSSSSSSSLSNNQKKKSEVVDLRGTFNNSQPSALSNLLTGISSSSTSNTSNTSTKESASTLLNGGPLKSVQGNRSGSRVGLFIMENNRLINLTSIRLDPQLASPNMVSILPPCDSFGGLAAVGDSSGSCVTLISLQEDHEWKLRVVDTLHFTAPLKPRGLLWKHTISQEKSAKQREKALLHVLCAQRCNNSKNSAPTLLTSSNLVDMQSFIYTYECNLPPQTSMKKLKRTQKKKKKKEEAEEQEEVNTLKGGGGSSREQTKDKLRQSFLTMLTDDPSFLDTDNDVDQDEATQIHISQTFVNPTQHQQAKTPAAPAAPPMMHSPTPSITTPSPSPSSPSSDFGSALVTLSIALGRMEEHLAGKMDQVLSVVEKNSDRISHLEDQFKQL